MARDTIVRFDDVVIDRDLDVLALRREMERASLDASRGPR